MKSDAGSERTLESGMLLYIARGRLYNRRGAALRADDSLQSITKANNRGERETEVYIYDCIKELGPGPLPYIE